MTSKQIMLILSAVTLLGVSAWAPGCSPDRVEPIVSPYANRQVFAVAPLRNESGSGAADGIRLADKLTQRLALARGLDVLPVNRVLAAMRALGMPSVTSKEDALQLRQTLGVDALVVGTVTAYEPYNPPKLGLNLELYLDGRLAWEGNDLDPRELSAAATDRAAVLPLAEAARRQPVTAIGGFYDAADPDVTDLLTAYLAERGRNENLELALRRHTLSIDLYSEFVSYQLTARLLQAEQIRLRRPQASNTAAPPARLQPPVPQPAYPDPARPR
ncbi:MAG: hypothetical protein AAGG38_11310 [Planctomycetota bacterium]